MSTLIVCIDRALYPSFESNWDDQLFRERILAHLRSDLIVLDLGTGAGIIAQMNFRQSCGANLWRGS
jgi:methylase of polypeptide subunit release factors